MFVNFMAFLFFVTKERVLFRTTLLSFQGFDFVAQHSSYILCDVLPIRVYQSGSKVNTAQRLEKITLMR